MLKKYAKRFSRTVMGGLGPGIRRPGAAVLLSPGDIDTAEFRWPPQSRKVVDDELVREETAGGGGDSIGRPKQGTLIAKDRCRVHLSSCSTTEEGFGSESSLEVVASRQSDESRQLIRRPSSTSTSSSGLSSVSSSSDGLLDIINQLRCTLYYYALVCICFVN